MKLAASGLEAVPAVNRAVPGRFKRNRGFLTAGGANGSEHRARLSIAGIPAALHFASPSALGAAAWFVLKALFSIKFLFRYREQELIATILTYDIFVL